MVKLVTSLSIAAVLTATSVHSFAPIQPQIGSRSSATSLGVGGDFLGVGKSATAPAVSPSTSGGGSKKQQLDPTKVDLWQNFGVWMEKKRINYRQHLSGNLLVSGQKLLEDAIEGEVTCNPEILYMILEEHNKFQFDKIYIMADSKDAMKYFLSRKARYAGLLDRLEIITPAWTVEDYNRTVAHCVVPTSAQIEEYGITNWILAHDEDHLEVLDIAYDVIKENKGSTLKNVVFGLFEYFEFQEVTVPILNKFDDFGGARHRNRDNLNPNEVYQPDDVKIAFLAFGNPTDHPEGQRRWSFNTLDPSVEIELEKDTQLEKESKSEEEGEEKEEEEASEESSQPSTMTAYLDPLVDTFSDEQAFRICVEALQLETFEGNAYMVYDHFVPLLDRTTRFTARAEKGMRELGYTSTEIYEHLFHYCIGTEYQSAYKHFQAQRKMGKGTTNWWDSPSFKKQIKERQALRNGGVYVEEVKEEDIDREEITLTPREQKIQDIAHEWGQRQFYKAKKEGTLNGRDLDTFLDDVWDEAVAEGLKQYNELKALGYLDFSAKQIEQKQMVLTKEASEAMGIVFTIPSYDDDDDDEDDDDDDDDE